MRQDQRPLQLAEFRGLADRLGPYERAPRVAVAVSGGADSMALSLLLAGWVHERGGRLDALTVDHGLRPESGAEAAAVGRQLRPFGIRHHVLHWEGPWPATGIQQAAREARYRLLFDWCARAGVMHLFAAHHLEDQVETFLMRVARGSGRRGLASMSPVVEHRGLRLLRPCLGVEGDRLRAALEPSSVRAVQDPSNRDPRYTRVCVRARLPSLARCGLAPRRLAGTTEDAGAFRQGFEKGVSRALAEAVSLHPAGFARMQLGVFDCLSPGTGLAVMDAVLGVVGGRAGTIRRASLERVCASIRKSRKAGRSAFRRGTLGGCLIAQRGEILLICREPAVARSDAIRGKGRASWDGRFEMEFSDVGARDTIGPLGMEGWAAILAHERGLRGGSLPWPVPAGLPAIRDADGLVEVPHLSYRRAEGGLDSVRVEKLAFRPVRPLAGPGFMVA